MTTVTDRTPSLDEQIAELSAHPHQLNRVDFEPGYGGNGDVEPAASAEVANLFSSLIVDGPEYGRHTIALDLDVPARLIPSTTEGHSHLYIDVPVEWESVVDLLNLLADMGIVEPGYAAASIRRGYTSLRLPWIRKGAPNDNA